MPGLEASVHMSKAERKRSPPWILSKEGSVWTLGSGNRSYGQGQRLSTLSDRAERLRREKLPQQAQAQRNALLHEIRRQLHADFSAPMPFFTNRALGSG